MAVLERLLFAAAGLGVGKLAWVLFAADPNLELSAWSWFGASAAVTLAAVLIVRRRIVNGIAVLACLAGAAAHLLLWGMRLTVVIESLMGVAAAAMLGAVAAPAPWNRVVGPPHIANARAVLARIILLCLGIGLAVVLLLGFVPRPKYILAIIIAGCLVSVILDWRRS